MKRVAYHGSKRLFKVIQDKAISCPGMVNGLFEGHLKIYEELVRHFAEALRARLAEQGTKVEDDPCYIASNQTEYVLADIVSQHHSLFGVRYEDTEEYKEKRRSVNVFMSNFLVAANYAQGLDRGVLECVIDDENITSQLDNSWTLVRGKVKLDDVRCIYVEPYRNREIRQALRRRGYGTPVRDITKRMKVQFGELRTSPSQPYRI